MCLFINRMIYFQIKHGVLLLLIVKQVLSIAYDPLLDEDSYENNQVDEEPIQKRRIKHENHGEENEYPRYKYGYSVHDPKTKDIKSAWEHRDGDVTHGEYSLVEPDGAIRIVKYVVDKDKGFQAIVDRIPPPQSKGETFGSHFGPEKTTQSFGQNYGSQKSSSLSTFNDDKFQLYYNQPQKNYDFNSVHFQIPNMKDFHQGNENPFTSSQADYQDFSVEMKAKKQNHFSSQQKESEEEEEEEEESEEQEDGDDEGEKHENEKDNGKYAGPVHQTDAPAYNYQTQNLQDVSHHYNISSFENHEAPPHSHQPYHQNFNPNLNQLQTGFDFSPIQTPFKPSQRDFSEVTPNLQPKQYNSVKVHPTGYFPKPSQGKTASYQSIQYNTPNYNTPNEHIHRVIHTNQENIPASPLQNLQPHQINMFLMRTLPHYEDNYYPAQNGNYKYSQPQVQTPLVGKVLSPPAHSFPSTSHLLIPPQEKLPNYNENQNIHSSHAQFKLPPPGTPISHNHHHEGEFERYD